MESKLLEKVRKLYNQGYGCTTIGRELDMAKQAATEYIDLIKIESGNIPPGLDDIFDDIKDCYFSGLGAESISRKLNISSSKARRALKLVKHLYPSKAKTHPNHKSGMAASNKNNNINMEDQVKVTKAQMKLMDKARPLVAQGMGGTKIAKALKITKGVADRLIKKLKNTQDKSIKQTEDYSVEMSYYDIAKEKGKSLISTKTMLEKEAGTYSPIINDFKKFASKTFTLNNAKRVFGFKSEKQLQKAIDENFPEHIVVKTPVDKDTAYTIMKNSSKDVEWLNIDTSKKQFTYYLAPEGNYLYIKFDDSINTERLRLYCLSDIHKGSKFHRGDLLKEHIEMIRKDPNAFVFLAGDLVEHATKMSVGDPQEQDLDNTAQCTEIVRDLMPIAHKILASVGGNHDAGRLEKAGQFDPARLMAQMLKIPYSQSRIVIDLYFKGVNKRVSLAHRYGNAYTIGAVEAEVKKIQAYQVAFVNCYMQGHNHKSFIIPEESLQLIPGKGFETVKWWIANNGSYMKRSGSYAEKAGYGPSPQSMVYYEFDSNGKDRCGELEMLSE